MDPTDEPELIKMESMDFWTNTKIKIVKKMLNKEKISNILDLGCGTGFISYSLAKMGYKVTGIDVSEKIVISAKKRYKNKNLQFIKKNILKTKLKPQFDCILILDVLEHIRNDLEILKKAKKLLKKGGILILKVPSYPSLYGMHDKVHGHYRRYSFNDLLPKLEKLGFSIENVKCYDIPALIASLTLAKIRPIGKEHLFIVKNPILRFLINLYYSIELLFPLPLGNSIVIKLKNS
jgi:ubiquinone/menaquinone biosynthesis C-methylase UbiE